MQAVIVKVHQHIVNVQAVADAHWERETLYLHFDGGRFAQLRGEEAQLIWSVLASMALDLVTGEEGEAVAASLAK